jgi:16S rRNA (uracil1498-N3)-methyltransferase
MHAILMRDLSAKDENIILDNESAFHLMKVLRVQKGEKVKVFNGEGLEILTEVSHITKAEITLMPLEFLTRSRNYKLDILFGIPKKEALELLLKISVELGVHDIIPWKSEFSQNKNYLTEERFEKLVESALIQSNNPFAPIYHTSKMLSEIKFEHYQYIYFFTSQNEENDEALSFKAPLAFDPNQTSLIVIGPEGGFSKKEHDFFISLKSSRAIQLPTPILRTPTALATCFGYVLALE